MNVARDREMSMCLSLVALTGRKSNAANGSFQFNLMIVDQATSMLALTFSDCTRSLCQRAEKQLNFLKNLNLAFSLALRDFHGVARP
jgi:hypothetical protein